MAALLKRRGRSSARRDLSLLAFVLNFAFTQLLPYPRRLTLAAAMLRLYQRSGLQRAIRPLLPERLRRMESMLPPISAKRFFAPDGRTFYLPSVSAEQKWRCSTVA